MAGEILILLDSEIGDVKLFKRDKKEYIPRYKKESGDSGLIDPHELAEWAYRHGLHKPNVRTIIDVIASDIAKAFREEYRTDAFGRRYRAKHATAHLGGVLPVTHHPSTASCVTRVQA